MNPTIEFTASSPNSTEDFLNIVGLYLGSSNQVMPKLDRLIASDAEMPMAHIMRAYLLKLASDPRFIMPAQSSLTTATKLHTNEREQMHIKALTVWFAGDMTQALDVLEHLLSHYPQDALALRLAHHLHFYSGDAIAMQRSIERYCVHYAPDDRYYSYVLGMHSFGCEEAGEYKKAEELGRMAVELEPTDQWATHAVAHVMQMQSRFDEGVEWLEQCAPNWRDSNNFVYHINWHQALFELGRNQPEQALQIYDNKLIKPLSDDFYLDVCNAASLLWRLEIMDTDVGDRWQALTPFNARTKDTELVFCTLHYLLAPARLGDQPAIAQAMLDLQKWKSDTSTQGQIVADVGENLANAICLLSDKQFQAAADTFHKVMPQLHKIGGSHAQRALFSDMKLWAEQQAA